MTSDERGAETAWEAAPAVRPPVYRIDERPARLAEAVLYGWQHTLVDVSPFVLPLSVAAAIGLGPGDQARLVSACLVAMGIATWLQTSIGSRLPIVQGPSATLIATLGPVGASLGAGAMWGAACAGALVETAAGALGLPGRLRRLFPPVVAGTVVMAIALALGQVAARWVVGDGRPANLGFAAATVALVLLLQLGAARLLGGVVARAAIFLAIAVVGVGVGSATGRVDWELVAAKPWIGLPGLFPWGGPGFGWTLAGAAVAGAALGYLGSIVESIGDYAATCAVSGERYTVRHMNRGIFAEGLGCLVALVLGGLPVTSYTQNVGVIAATGVASRFVVRIAGGVLVAYGLCPKLGALLVAIPRPVLGGVFLLVCGLIAASGLRLVASAAPGPADGAVAGLTLVTALALPTHVRALPDLHPAAALVLGNTVVVAVVMAIVLHLAVAGLSRR